MDVIEYLNERKIFESIKGCCSFYDPLKLNRLHISIARGYMTSLNRYQNKQDPMNFK